jgi:hypothetical protein
MAPGCGEIRLRWLGEGEITGHALARQWDGGTAVHLFGGQAAKIELVACGGGEASDCCRSHRRQGCRRYRRDVAQARMPVPHRAKIIVLAAWRWAPLAIEARRMARAAR